MRFINWVKGLFGFKEKSKGKKFSFTKRKKLFLKIKKPSKLQLALKDIENNRTKLSNEKRKEKAIKIYKQDNGFFIGVGKNLYSIDGEGMKFFEEEFNDSEWEIVNLQGKSNTFYLGRRNKKTGKIEYFHRKFLRKEIEDFAVENNIDNLLEVEIHHENGSQFNERKYLTIMSKEEHEKEHSRKTKNNPSTPNI